MKRNYPRVCALGFGLVLTAARSWAQVAAADSQEFVQSLKQMSVEQLMDLEVTSVSKRPEKFLEVASALQLITGEDIRRSGATSLPEALRLAGNLEVAQKNASGWGISARGFNTDLANKLLVLVDGRTVYTPLYSGVFWDRQDYLLADIDRIEVISGPGATLWGANAVNGVINITSKDAADTQGLYVEAGGGTELRGFTGIRYGGEAAPNVHYRIYGKYSDRGSELLPGGAEAGDSWRMGQGGLRIDAGLTGGDKLTVQGDYYRNDENQPGTDLTGGTAHTWGGNLLGRWTHHFSADAECSLQSYYDRTHLVVPAAPLVINGLTFAPAGTFSDDLDTYDVDFQLQLNSGARQRLVCGVGYRFTHDETGNAPALAFLPATLRQDLFSAFAQDEIKVRDDLALTLGSKVEHNDYTGAEIEPGVRLLWNPTPRQVFWSAISRAVRAPSRIDRDISEGEPPYLVLLKGGADFQSETVLAYELGWRAQLGDRAATSVSLYYNRYSDVRSTSFTPTTILPFYFANNLEGETHGLEWNLHCQVNPAWRVTLNYNLLEEHLHVKPGQADLNNARNELADPQQQFSVRSAVNLPHRIELDAAFRWVDTLHNNSGPTPGTVPSYGSLDFRIGWRPSEQVEFSVVGQNLLDGQHPEYGFPSATREEIRRSVYAKVAWRY